MEEKDKIILMRKKLGYSQEKFAKELGVAFVTVNRWENGHFKPTKKTRVRIESYAKRHKISFEE
jgi:DNA-binding XRE family transcriptional regulator